MLKKLVTKFNPWIFLDGSMSNLGLDSYDLGVLCFSLLVLLIVSSLQQKYKVRELLAKQNIVFSKLLIMLLIFMVIIFGFYGLTYDESSFNISAVLKEEIMKKFVREICYFIILF